jgi:ATP-dependent Zn protease
MRKSEREAVLAYHETGHAVIARALGIHVTYVTIFPTDATNLANAET